jgi:hypothetical protein
MRKLTILATLTLGLTITAATQGQDPQQPPPPQKEHDWLKQFAGEWETEADLFMEPGKPPVKSKGSENVRLIGDFWLMGEFKGDFMGAPMTGIMTIGFDSKKKKFVGTWICNMSDCICNYEGALKGQTLSLDTEGPHPSDPNKTCKMRDVVELKDINTKVLTSTMQNDDGSWTTIMTMKARRKK